MIIGKDLTKKLRMVLDFKNEYLIWGYSIVPM